jgi:maleate cis-trans isomerase
VLCIVATDLPAVSEIAALEKELGKPVVATNQAILWKSLVLAGIADAVEGFGRLLANPRKATA